MVYYFSVVAPEINPLNIQEKLQEIRLSLPPNKNSKKSNNSGILDNPQLTYDQFLSIFYRLAILFYDLNNKPT